MLYHPEHPINVWTHRSLSQLAHFLGLSDSEIQKMQHKLPLRMNIIPRKSDFVQDLIDPPKSTFSLSEENPLLLTAEIRLRALMESDPIEMKESLQHSETEELVHYLHFATNEKLRADLKKLAELETEEYELRQQGANPVIAYDIFNTRKQLRQIGPNVLERAGITEKFDEKEYRKTAILYALSPELLLLNEYLEIARTFADSLEPYEYSRYPLPTSQLIAEIDAFIALPEKNEKELGTKIRHYVYSLRDNLQMMVSDAIRKGTLSIEEVEKKLSEMGIVPNQTAADWFETHRLFDNGLIEDRIKKLRILVETTTDKTELNSIIEGFRWGVIGHSLNESLDAQLFTLNREKENFSVNDLHEALLDFLTQLSTQKGEIDEHVMGDVLEHGVTHLLNGQWNTVTRKSMVASYAMTQFGDLPTDDKTQAQLFSHPAYGAYKQAELLDPNGPLGEFQTDISSLLDERLIKNELEKIINSLFKSGDLEHMIGYFEVMFKKIPYVTSIFGPDVMQKADISMRVALEEKLGRPATLEEVKEAQNGSFYQELQVKSLRCLALSIEESQIKSKLNLLVEPIAKLLVMARNRPQRKNRWRFAFVGKKSREGRTTIESIADDLDTIEYEGFYKVNKENLIEWLEFLNTFAEKVVAEKRGDLLISFFQLSSMAEQRVFVQKALKQ